MNLKGCESKRLCPYLRQCIRICLEWMDKTRRSCHDSRFVDWSCNTRPPVHEVQVGNYVARLWWLILRAFNFPYAPVGFHFAFWATKWSKCLSMAHIAVYSTGSFSGGFLFGRCQLFWLRAFVVSIGHSSQMLGQCFNFGKTSSFETLSQFITHPSS